MADFKTHFNVAAVGAGLAATTLLVAGLAQPDELLLFFSLGIVGGLLPDLDLDHSTPLEIVFNLVGVLLSFLLIFHLSGRFAVLELALFWLLCFLFIKVVIYRLFTALTEHRGVFHSVPGAGLAGLLTSAALFHLAGVTPVVAWIGGLFLALGYLTHLVLDEIYSVNLFGGHTKKSLGSAFKFFSGDVVPTILLYVALAAAFLIAPEAEALLAILAAPETYAGMENRFLPKVWFEGLR